MANLETSISMGLPIGSTQKDQQPTNDYYGFNMQFTCFRYLWSILPELAVTFAESVVVKYPSKSSMTGQDKTCGCLSKDLFPTRFSLFIFVLYMALFINQGKLI